MSQRVTLELPDEVARRGRALAAQSHRPFEEFLVAWIDQALTELPPVDLLSDEEVLLLCDSQMEEEQQRELNSLLDRGREGELRETEKAQLDELLAIYRRGLVRKADALKVAVNRGLKPPLK